MKTLDEAIAALDARFERWELRRYTQKWTEEISDPMYTVGLPYTDRRTVKDSTGQNRLALRDCGWSADPLTAVICALQEFDESSATARTL